MKNRCYNEKVKAYPDYGGRGISVCDEWKESYASFKEWSLANGYAEGLSIDRIDNDANYSPENCRWVDCVAQANNRRSNRLLTLNGETHNIAEWSEMLNIPYKRLHNRIQAGWSVERALTT